MRTRALLLTAALFLVLSASREAAAIPVKGTGWFPPGTAAFDHFGTSVSTAGDVNGDGLSDVIVGSPLEGPGGKVYVYHGGVYPPLETTADWTVSAPVSNSQFGTSVAPAGDVNGDGFGDVIVGAPIAGSTGAAYVYMGSASGLGTTPAWSKTGSTDSKYGWCVAPAGDVNGDGYDDVLVGAPNWGAAFGTFGRVYLYLGSASGLSTSQSWSFTGDTSGQMGYAAATAGDVNADGYADVVIGDPGYNLGTVSPDAGRVLLFMGDPSGVLTQNAWVLYGPGADAQYGMSVATAGDFDKDGYADVIVGAPKYPSGTESGRMMLFWGTSTGLSASNVWTVNGTSSGDNFGASVAPAGDLDGNGYPEIIVGAPQVGSSNVGQVKVFTWNNNFLDSNADWTYTGSQSSAYLGNCVATAGDVDGDGFSDLVVGEYLYDGPAGLNTGRAILFRGSTHGMSSLTTFSRYGTQFDENYGQTLSSAGDVNGDGYEDLLIGSYEWNGAAGIETGRVELVYGGEDGLQTTAPPVWSYEGAAAGDILGTAVSRAGDVNGDGYDDLLVGAPGDDSMGPSAGQAFVFLGSPSGPGVAPDWASNVGGPGDETGCAVAAAGDVNGDGYCDVIVGARLAAVEGAAYCFLGSPTGLAATPVWTRTGVQTGEWFGHAVASCDKDGDGYSDLFVGAPYYDVLQPDQGRVLGYRGGPTGPDTTATWQWDGSQFAPAQSGLNLGYAVSGVAAPDVWGDGIAFSSPWYDHGGLVEAGLVHFEYATVSVDLYGTQAGEHFGFSLADAGDANGDSRGNLIIGSPNKTSSFTNEGGWCVLETWVMGTQWAYSGQTYAQGGFAVGAGDWNGDGLADPVASAPSFISAASAYGRVMGRLGGYNQDVTPLLPTLRNSQDEPVSRLTNTNQLDRIRIQTARAQSPAGRIPVRHEYWLYPTLDDPYLGDLVVNPTGSWTDTGPVVSGLSATTLDDEIAGLTAGTLYSVQWRVRSRSPYFPNSRWLRVDQAGRNQGHFRTPTTLLAAENPALTPPSLLAFPNPFRAGTRLRYTLDEPGRIDVQVFDAAGRLVRTLCAGDRPAGGGELHWDGQDARGLRAAPGIYFVRVVTARAEEAVRIVRMP